MYFPSFTFCAVPVFPPTLRPSIYAFLPLPFVTTDSKALLTSFDVLSLITFLTIVFLFSFIIEFVSGSFKLFTMYGLYKTPPFIAADTAVICCNVV